ncbi:hypothetical protein ACFYZB_00405 [Streptomyces sp. NPDC001852]|uniref:hypothetical protein n=1 Tax=Streptomyces sp. NPDC001852 TaxID=3364619 RepID=UPI003695E032
MTAEARRPAGCALLAPVAEFGASRRVTSLDALAPREREAHALMAEGRTNQSVARAFTVFPRVEASS